MRVMTTSRSTGLVEASLAALGVGTFFLLHLQLMQIVVEAIKAFRPELAIAFHPFGDVLERDGLEAAGTALSVAAARNQAGAFQHFEVLGDGGLGHGERLGKICDRGLAGGEAGENGAARGIGKRSEGGVEGVLSCITVKFHNY